MQNCGINIDKNAEVENNKKNCRYTPISSEKSKKIMDGASIHESRVDSFFSFIISH